MTASSRIVLIRPALWAALCAIGLSGCANLGVQPWERDLLAKNDAIAALKQLAIELLAQGRDATIDHQERRLIAGLIA